MKAEDIGKMSALSLYSEALALKQKRIIAPRMAIVHATNLCNHNCLGCEYASVHTTKPAQLKTERLFSLIDEIADLGTASILFSGGGEPTLHHDFDQALAKAHKRNLLIGIFSNGAGINSKLANCIAKYATFIRISIDAATPETYALIRQVKPIGFAKIKLTLDLLRAAKDKHNPNLDIGVKFLIRPENIGEIYYFVAMCKKLHINNVQFKLLRNQPEELNSAQILEAQDLIDHAKVDFPMIKIQGKLPMEIMVTEPCWISPLRVVISAEGDVHLCNYFNHRRQTHTFGNINKKPLSKIWFSQRHQRALKNIKPAECGLYDCRFHKLNGELLDLVENQRQKLDFI